MKRFACGAALMLAASMAEAGSAISIGEPGFYGVLDIRNYPAPRLLDDDPVIVRPLSVGALARPIYLYVPRSHTWRWKKYCHSYGACSRPVYFVTREWYEKVYVPQYREERRRAAIVRRKATGSRDGAEF